MTVKFWSTTGTYGFMSNFYESPIVVDDKSWPTTEHFFQAMKFLNMDAHVMVGDQKVHMTEYIRLHCKTPKEAATWGRKREYPIRPDWEKIKETVMTMALCAKFSQHPQLAEKLLATGDEDLVEDSPVDFYWGVGRNGTGQNRLGALLMEVREALKEGKEL